jgi:hypothetical protein
MKYGYGGEAPNTESPFPGEGGRGWVSQKGDMYPYF